MGHQLGSGPHIAAQGQNSPRAIGSVRLATGNRPGRVFSTGFVRSIITAKPSTVDMAKEVIYAKAVTMIADAKETVESLRG